MQIQQIGSMGMHGLNIEAQLATKLVEALAIISYCSPEERDGAWLIFVSALLH